MALIEPLARRERQHFWRATSPSLPKAPRHGTSARERAVDQKAEVEGLSPLHRPLGGCAVSRRTPLGAPVFEGNCDFAFFLVTSS
jgi:hypothetical protein